MASRSASASPSCTQSKARIREIEVKAPADQNHLTRDFTREAQAFIHDHKDEPFFLYYATGAGHAPHHVPKEWADKYTGKFDAGWDVYREIVHQRQIESVADVESPGPETEFLTLSTIHSAKGLEWNAVFVIYALEGRFPAMRAVGTDEEIEEERRLMYVACTRAKDHLFITYPINIYDRESGMILSKPSRFIQGIKEQLLEPWVIE